MLMPYLCGISSSTLVGMFLSFHRTKNIFTKEVFCYYRIPAASTPTFLTLQGKQSCRQTYRHKIRPWSFFGLRHWVGTWRSGSKAQLESEYSASGTPLFLPLQSALAAPSIKTRISWFLATPPLLWILSMIGFTPKLTELRDWCNHPRCLISWRWRNYSSKEATVA